MVTCSCSCSEIPKRWKEGPLSPHFVGGKTGGPETPLLSPQVIPETGSRSPGSGHGEGFWTEQECGGPHWALGLRRPLPRERGLELRWERRWREPLGGQNGTSQTRLSGRQAHRLRGAAEISHTAAQTHHPRTRGPAPMRARGYSHHLTARVTNEQPTDVFCLACRVLLKI